MDYFKASLGFPYHSIYKKLDLMIPKGPSKSTFVEEGRVGGHYKADKNKQGEGWSLHVCRFTFFEKNAEIFKMKFYSYSAVFPIDYNGSIKY